LYIERKIDQFLTGKDQSEKRLTELNKEVTNAVKLYRTGIKPQEKLDLKSREDYKSQHEVKDVELRDQRLS